jgi:cytochrome P450
MLSGYDTESRGLAWLRKCVAGERAELGMAFNPLADSFRRDPEAVYAQLRDRSPVHFSRLLDCWIVTRHGDVDQALRASDVFRSDPRSSTQDLIDPFVLLDPDHPALFMLDPPDHTRLRGVVHNAFSPGSIRRLMPRLEECIRELVESLGRPGDRVELVSQFASVVPLRALDLVTGFQTRDPGTVAGWVSAVVCALEPIATARTAAESLESYHALGAYLDEQRSRQFGEDTLCGSLQQAVCSGLVSDAEARQLLLFIVLAGTKTVADFLAGAARQLTALPVTAPERQCVSSALIDDLLKLTSPVQIVARTAAKPAVLSGQAIQAGQRVLLVLASANRDLEIEPRDRDGRDRNAKVRRVRRDVTFGQGSHLCLGSHFARLQSQLALSMLLTAFPGVKLIDATQSRRCVTLRSWESVVVHL